MAELILGQVVSLSGDAADKLIARGEGDAALLCLALLRHSDAEKARKGLGWSSSRADGAWSVLKELGLVAGESAPTPERAVLEPEGPPDYLRADIMIAMQEGTFQSLYHAVERRLGKKLSDSDLKSLYEIYDFLGLSVEVILIMLTRCVEDFQRRYGSGRMPKMPLVKKTAYAWHRMGIDTVDAAEAYLKKQDALRAREREILPLLDITGRLPVAKEQEYVAAWVDWGFPNEAIRLAYERTIMQKQSMNWPYMNSILKRWHEAGLHTVQEIRTGDTGRDRKKPTATVAATQSQSFDESLRRDMEWLKRFAQENEMGGS